MPRSRCWPAMGAASPSPNSRPTTQGRFRVNPPPADRTVTIIAYPPEGQPYLIATESIEWPKGALEQSLDLALRAAS